MNINAIAQRSNRLWVTTLALLITLCALGCGAEDELDVGEVYTDIQAIEVADDAPETSEWVLMSRKSTLWQRRRGASKVKISGYAEAAPSWHAFMLGYARRTPDTWEIVVSDCSGETCMPILVDHVSVECTRRGAGPRASVSCRGRFELDGDQVKIVYRSSRSGRPTLVKYDYKGVMDYEFGEGDLEGQLEIRSLQSGRAEALETELVLPFTLERRRGPLTRYDVVRPAVESPQ